MTFILRPMRAVGDDRADIAAADDAQRLAGDFDAEKLFFSHLPAWVEASASGICRASANISVMACSAVVIELPNGVFITMMPRAVAGGMSTLSTPMPARPITFRRRACARIFAVTLVAERIASPS